MSSAEAGRAKGASRAKAAARAVAKVAAKRPAKQPAQNLAKAAQKIAAAKKPLLKKPASKQPAAKRSVKPASTPPGEADGMSGEAQRLAELIDQALESGRPEALSRESLQALLAALCKNYSARVEAGEDFLPLSARGRVTPTDVMVTASKLLRSANLQVFELGMWQSWTGR